MRVVKVVLLLVMSTVLIACGSSDEAPKEVVKEFAEAIISGDGQAMVDLMYISDEMQKELDRYPNGQKMLNIFISKMLKQIKFELEKKGGVKEFTVGKPTYNSDKTTAKVPLTITMNKNNASKTSNIMLIKIDGVWKIELPDNYN